jgi:alanine-alpha-ketoisovalerate/valine-pyruvate aminotransferase
VLTYSLSKIGLPGTRTGIVIGPPEIIRALGSMSAIVGLSNPNIGQQIMLPLVESGEILSAIASSTTFIGAKARCSSGYGSPACRSPRANSTSG